MNNFWELLDELARVSVIVMVWYFGGFILGSSIIYSLHWLGLL